MSAPVLPYATNYIRMLQKAWWQRIGSIIFGRKLSSFAGANGTFSTQAKAVSAGVLKEIHSLICDGETESRLIHIKQNQQTQNE